MTHSGPQANGCNPTCTDGWIRGRGEWVHCPNHRMRQWPIGPMPPPVKTAGARRQIELAKAAAAAAQLRGDETKRQAEHPAQLPQETP